MSDDEISNLKKTDFQVILKPALLKAFEGDDITELGNKLDSLDGKTYLLLCSQKKDNTINKLMNIYGIAGPLANKIYANLIAPRNTNQSKAGPSASGGAVLPSATPMQLFIPSPSIENQFPHFVHHPFVNRKKEVLEFACQSILNNLRHGRDDNTLRLILCIQRFGSGKTFFGYNLQPQSILEREDIIQRLVSKFNVTNTNAESELQRFSQAKLVYLNVQQHVGSLKTWKDLRQEIIANMIGSLKESPEIQDAIRGHFARTNLETTSLDNIMKELNQILVSTEKRGKEEEKWQAEDLVHKGRAPAQGFLFIFDEIGYKILNQTPTATDIEKYYNFWIEVNALLTNHHYLYVIGHTHHLYSLGMGLAATENKKIVSPGKVARITMNPFEPEHLEIWYREKFPSQRPLTEEESKEIQAVTGGLPRITEKTLHYLNAKRTEDPQSSVSTLLKSRSYLRHLMTEIPIEINPLSFPENAEIPKSYLQFVIFSLYQMPINLQQQYYNKAKGENFSLLHAFEWLCIHFKSTSRENYVIPVIPPIIARGITDQTVRQFFLSMRSLAQGDKLEIASFYGLAFRYLDSVYYESDKFTLSDHFPYLKDAFCAHEVLTPISFQLETITNEETLNSKIPAWDFPKMASNGSKKWNDDLKWLIQTSPEEKNQVKEILQEKIAKVQKAHEEEKDPGERAKLKQDLDTLGEELEKRTKNRVADYSLWPQLIKSAVLRVIYQPWEKSASADKIIFFAAGLLVIQDKNVNRFNFQQLSEEIDKVKEASTTKKITMLLISRSLDSGMVDALDAREGKDPNRLAYRLGPTEELSYHVAKKTKGKKAEDNQGPIKIPENMEVFVLTELGVKHFISSENFEKLVTYT